MANIAVMDENLANKIAAGEVIEKTMNVVKELVENSIDAGSDEIKIILYDSGVKEITVIDNGAGMDKEDAMRAFLRHATSKLKNLEDLFYISSLGFRGEALPSIASVSHLVMKTSNGKIGTEVIIEGGEVKEVKCELKVLADVGLVGLPSVGKSTILSVISASKPKIAAYHYYMIADYYL